MFKKIMYISILVVAIVLSGCATNASPERMAYVERINQKLNNQSFFHNINVTQVSGGHESNPLWTSQINNQGFKDALKKSLELADLEGDAETSKYDLTATLVKLQQPFVGLNMTVTSEVNYNLTNRIDHTTIYNKNITSSYTAKIDDNWYGVERLRTANEGAAKENIRKFIFDLYSK